MVSHHSPAGGILTTLVRPEHQQLTCHHAAEPTTKPLFPLAPHHHQRQPEVWPADMSTQNTP